MNNLIPFLLFATSASFTPGPNNFMIMHSGMQHGIKASLPHYFGICLGFSIMMFILAFGLGTVFTQYAWIKEALKIIGSVYMLYLSYKILTSHNNPNVKNKPKALTFLQASLFQWVNPKAWLMGVSAISIFTLSNDYVINAFWTSLLYFLTCIPCAGAWLVFGKILQNVLKTDKHRLWFNIMMAFALVASIGMIFID